MHKVRGDSCEFAEDAIYLDGNERGTVIKVCVEKTCKTHNRTGSRGSSEPDPVKAKADRKKLLARVKVEKEYRLQLFRELMTKSVDPAPTDEMVYALVMFAMGKIDSTKHDVISQMLDWPKEYFGWQREQKGALARLSMLSQGEALRFALVGLEADELTVHEHDVDRWKNAGAKGEIGLERVAKILGGVDTLAIRKRVDPEAVKPKKAPAKKTAVAKGKR